jgi:hypothetical protein
LEALRVQDAQEADQKFSEGGEGSAVMPDVTTLGPDAPAADTSTTAAPAPSLSTSDQSTLSTLSSAQVQYRAALRGGFDLFRSTLLSCSDAEVQATKHLWSPMVNLAAWDRLAGANRLNCTQTQTALPFPHEGGQAVATAPASASAAAASSSATPAAAASTSSSSVDGSFPPLATVLESLFLPLGLPLASARALLLLHSKMNHACPSTRASTALVAAGSSNARVENERESSDIAWSALSERRAHARAVEIQSAQQRRLELEAAAKTSATGANASNGNRKKKIQKIRKEAAAQRALEAKRAEQRWKDEEDTLVALLAQPQPQPQQQQQQQQGGSPAAAAAASADTQSQSAPAAATAPSFHPSSSAATIVVRASRAIQAGEEVLISYLPPAVAKSDTRSRREYLQNNYLFECKCAVCNASDSPATATASASSAASKAQA